MTELKPARLRGIDVVRLAAYGLRSRPLRVILSALGIAIGIAAMIAVVGISTSSRAQLDQLLAQLGTNLLTAGPGTSLFGEASTMPDEAVEMAARIPSVLSVTATGQIEASVYRTNRIPVSQSGGIAVYAARTDLLATLGASMASGTWLNEATASFPAVVLGARAAARLGIAGRQGDVRIWLGEQWFTVIGILAPVSLVPSLDLGAFVGWPAGEHYLDFEISPPSTSGPRPMRWTPSATCWPAPPTPNTPTRSTSRGHPMRSPPRRRSTSPSPA